MADNRRGNTAVNERTGMPAAPEVNPPATPAPVVRDAGDTVIDPLTDLDATLARDSSRAVTRLTFPTRKGNYTSRIPAVVMGELSEDALATLAASNDADGDPIGISTRKPPVKIGNVGAVENLTAEGDKAGKTVRKLFAAANAETPAV